VSDVVAVIVVKIRIVHIVQYKIVKKYTKATSYSHKEFGGLVNVNVNVVNHDISATD